jgi:hypothetical protein
MITNGDPDDVSFPINPVAVPVIASDDVPVEITVDYNNQRIGAHGRCLFPQAVLDKGWAHARVRPDPYFTQLDVGASRFMPQQLDMARVCGRIIWSIWIVMVSDIRIASGESKKGRCHCRNDCYRFDIHFFLLDFLKQMMCHDYTASKKAL